MASSPSKIWVPSCEEDATPNPELLELFLLSLGRTFPLPLWDQRGGSSWPRGRRPFSRQVRNARRWPPLGKWMGGYWTPSCPTRTRVPPLSAAQREGEEERERGKGGREKEGKEERWKEADN